MILTIQLNGKISLVTKRYQYLYMHIVGNCRENHSTVTINVHITRYLSILLTPTLVTLVTIVKGGKVSILNNGTHIDTLPYICAPKMLYHVL
jgi:hypothetical protein